MGAYESIETISIYIYISEVWEKDELNGKP